MELPLKKLKLPKGSERTALFICLGIAFLIWLFLKLSKEYETQTTIYLDYRLPPLMELTEFPASSLEATVSGRGFDLTKLYVTKRKPVIHIDLSDYAKPEIQRNELIRKIEEELSLNVLDINRNYLTFSIDSTTTRMVPVELNLELEFARDYFMKDSIHLSADSVIIAGASNEIETITSIGTSFVSLKNVNKDIRRELDLVTTGYKTLNTLPEKIELFIPVEQFTEKHFEVSVEVIHSEDSVQIIPSVVELECTVGLSRYHQLSPSDFNVIADIEDVVIPETQTSVPLRLAKSPPFVRSVRIKPDAVEYFIVR